MVGSINGTHTLIYEDFGVILDNVRSIHSYTIYVTGKSNWLKSSTINQEEYILMLIWLSTKKTDGIKYRNVG